MLSQIFEQPKKFAGNRLNKFIYFRFRLPVQGEMTAFESQNILLKIDVNYPNLYQHISHISMNDDCF